MCQYIQGIIVILCPMLLNNVTLSLYMKYVRIKKEKKKVQRWLNYERGKRGFKDREGGE